MILLPTTAQRIARIPFLFRAHECLDSTGLYALSYGQRVYAVHTRAGAAASIDQSGRIFRAPSGMPRLIRALSGGVRVPALLCEPGVTNYLAAPQDFSDGAWSKTNVTVTANAAIAPDGSLTADKVAATAAVATTMNQVATTISTTVASAVIYGSIGSGATDCNRFLLRNETTAVTLVDVTIDWATGVVTGTGAVSEDAGSHDGAQWWRLTLTATSGLTAGDDVSFWPGFVGVGETAGEFAYLWQGELSPTYQASSPILSGASRVADVLYFPLAIAPQALTLYQRTVNVGLYRANVGTRYGARIGSATATDDPRIALYASSAGTFGALADDGAVGQVSSAFSQLQALGAMVEHRGVFSAARTIQVHRTVDGSAESSGTESAATGPISAFAAPRLYVSDPISPIAYCQIVIAPGAVGLDELRDLCEVG